MANYDWDSLSSSLDDVTTSFDMFQEKRLGSEIEWPAPRTALSTLPRFEWAHYTQHICRFISCFGLQNISKVLALAPRSFSYRHKWQRLYMAGDWTAPNRVQAAQRGEGCERGLRFLPWKQSRKSIWNWRKPQIARHWLILLTELNMLILSLHVL